MKLKPNTETEYEAYKAKNSSNPYSARVVSYGEDWANLMETRLETGEQLTDIAKDTSHEADTVAAVRSIDWSLLSIKD